MTPLPNLDRTDRRILAELQRDARLPLRELAATVSAAPSTCSERTRRLTSQGVITGFHADVSLDALGRSVQALVFTQIRPLSRALIDGFHHDALAMPEVMAVFVLAGGDDFLLHIGVNDNTALHAFLVDKLSRRKEVISFRTSIIFTHGRKPFLEDLADDEPGSR